MAAPVMADRETFSRHVKYFFLRTLGFGGASNIASWMLAGGLAYVLWIKPEQEAQERRKLERAAAKARAIASGTLEVDRVKPIPDIQDTGLIKGNRKSRKPAPVASSD